MNFASCIAANATAPERSWIATCARPGHQSLPGMEATDTNFQDRDVDPVARRVRLNPPCLVRACGLDVDTPETPTRSMILT